MKKGNLLTAALCIILGAVIIAVASGYPTAADYGTGVPGPGLWPIVISILMLVCSALLIFNTMRMKPEENTKIELKSSNQIRVYICMGILLVYVAVLETVGFIISTIVMQFIFMQWFAKKKPWITLIISVAVTMVVYAAFKYILNVPIDFGMFAI